MTVTHQPIIVKNELPASVVALSDETVAQVADLTTRAELIQVDSIETLEEAEALFVQVDALNKHIAKVRLGTTRPIDDFKKAIIAAERSATTPLSEAKQALGKRVLDYRNKVEAERREAERKAREEANRIAREEQAKADAERQAAIDRAKEEAELFGSPINTENIPQPKTVVPVQKEQPITKQLPKSKVRTAKRDTLDIFDPEAFFKQACQSGGYIGGVQVLKIDEKALKGLLKLGASGIEGARLTTKEGIAKAGAR